MMQERNGDPALEAAQRVQVAERAFFEVPRRTVNDEFGTSAMMAQTRWEAAERDFADCIPSSCRGAICKLRAVIDLCQGSGLDDESLELRHLRSLQAYLEAIEYAQPAVRVRDVAIAR